MSEECHDDSTKNCLTSQPKICFIRQQNGRGSFNGLFMVTIQSAFLVSTSTTECPVTWCKKEIKKNCSIEDHMKSHLSSILEELKKDVRNEVSSFSVKFLCPDSACKHSEERNIGSFEKLKYLKQHYLKVHAPKSFKCCICSRTFATKSYLCGHQAMCGKSFECSCKMTYSTLESLQTHARRKQHEYDAQKYRNLLSAERSRMTKEASERDIRSSEPAVMPTSTSNSCHKAKYPLIFPKKVILPAACDLLRLQDSSQFGILISEIPSTKTFVDFGTQTVPNVLGHSYGGYSSVSALTNMKPPQIDTQDSRPTKRKKTAETQTAKLKVRISTETQTTNVIKRRRSTRKKQSAEAETQCQPAVSHNLETKNVSVVPTYTSETNQVLKTSVSTSTEMNSLSFEEDSLFKDLEVHIQTQTDPDLLLGSGSLPGDYDVHINMNDCEVSSFLNFVNTETQTGQPHAHGSWSSSFLDCGLESNEMGSLLPDEIGGSNLQPLGSTYLETMDSETQTPFGDFQTMFSDVFQF